MKELSLYKIRDLALKSKRAVYSIQQLSNLMKRPKSIAKVYSSRLVKHGLAKRLLRGKISFSDDDYTIASQLLEPSYISLSSALLFHKLSTQVPSEVQCITPKNSRHYKGLKLVYHKIPPSLFFGYRRRQLGSSYILVADPEKALIDSVYLNQISQESSSELMKNLDKNKLANYLERFRGDGRKKLGRWLLR